MKKSKIILMMIVMLLLCPVVVQAKTYSNDEPPLAVALAFQLLATIHMSLFVLRPLSERFSKGENSKKLFWIMFVIRWIILLLFDFFVTTFIAFVDFFVAAIGVFLIKPMGAAKNNLILKCTKCGNTLAINHKFCTNCGEPFDGNNVKVESTNSLKSEDAPVVFATPSSYDSMYSLNEEDMIEEFIKRELIKAKIYKKDKLIPIDILKRKKILNTIFSLLLFIYICLIFFHFPILTYILGFLILIVLFVKTRKYDLVKYLKKQIKSRPNEKISNIVLHVKTTACKDTSNRILLVSVLLSIILPLFIFIKPIILYEKIDGGYAVRFYLFGVTNFKSATIPETYKNESVISLRGNTFSNMYFLQDVNLPDTIIEIRGQAFKNNRNLVNVELPSNLNYLGGGAFYNCTKLTHIEIPNSVTYIGGEAFYNAKSLKSIKLSNNLSEIRGNTFENCKSLESIVIPDSVTRIGGHAFYGNTSLSNVKFTENSNLTEIGSSAFRKCTSLYEIILPKNIYINERAFKESPTTKKYYN